MFRNRRAEDRETVTSKELFCRLEVETWWGLLPQSNCGLVLPLESVWGSSWNRKVLLCKTGKKGTTRVPGNGFRGDQTSLFSAWKLFSVHSSLLLLQSCYLVFTIIGLRLLTLCQVHWVKFIVCVNTLGNRPVPDCITPSYSNQVQQLRGYWSGL